jgi:hypothetical protein
MGRALMPLTKQYKFEAMTGEFEAAILLAFRAHLSSFCPQVLERITTRSITRHANVSQPKSCVLSPYGNARA